MARFGPFTLDPERGELRKDGRPVRLQPQPTKLLSLLVSRADDVVTREDIQKALWSDGTVVDYDQSINFCIRRIREELEDDAETPRFVETVFRRGYRFVAHVEPAPSSASHGGLGSRWVVIVLVLAAGLLVATLAHRPTTSDEVLPVARPFTSFEGYENEPAFSPDGRQIAYTWDGGGDGYSHVYVKLVAGGEPLQLTRAAADDWYPVWSPDGSQIAFLRNVSPQENWAGARRPLEILTIPGLGGPERLVGRTTVPFRVAWHPDGEHLMIGDDSVPQKGLVLLSLRTGEMRRFTFPSESVQFDRSPAFSPDGKSLAFVRGPRLSLNAGNLYVQDANGGDARQVTFGHRRMAGFAWTPDGDALVFSAAVAFDWRLWKVGIDTGDPEPLQGTEGARYPSLAGDRLAFARDVRDLNIWRVGGPTAHEPAPPERLVASTRDDHLADYSPDGAQIAFVSDRDGEPAVWVTNASGKGERRLAEGLMFAKPRWSPKGDEVAYAAPISATHCDIFVVNARGGPPRNVTRSDSVDLVPSWSPDGEWIYFASLRTGQWEIWRIPSQGGEAVHISRGGGQMPFALRDRVYYWWDYKIWSVALDVGEATVTLDTLTNSWTVWDEKIVYVNQKGATETVIELFDPASRETREIASLGASPSLSLGLAVSPDGKSILYNQNDQAGSDIVLVDGFDP